MDNCVFCRIIEGEIPADKVYEDDICLAFRDINPQAPVHILVIPKTHIASAADITPENSAVVAHIFEVIGKLAVSEGLNEGFRLISNAGERAGQTVPHLHFHILAKRNFSGTLVD